MRRRVQTTAGVEESYVARKPSGRDPTRGPSPASPARGKVRAREGEELIEDHSAANATDD